MEHRKLGSSDLKVSVVGLGCNNFGGRIDFEATERVVNRALELGINFFDTADVYGNRGKSEEFLGKALGQKRKDIILATKFAIPMSDEVERPCASAKYVAEACEASLKRLNTDCIDLYQIHTTVPETPIEETLGALNKLVEQGKVRNIGCSNFPSWRVVDALWTSKAKNFASFVSCQDEYSLLVRDLEREEIPAMRHFGLGLLPYFPLASGLLTGKYRQDQPFPEGTRYAGSKGLADRYLSKENWHAVEGLRDFAEQNGHTLLDLAFSWLLANPVTSSVIAGATKPEQIEQNVAAASWTLTPEQTRQIDSIAPAKG